MEWLDQSEIANLSPSPFQPDRDKNNLNIKTAVGVRSNEFTIQFSAQGLNHVPFAFTDESLQLLLDPEVSQFLNAWEYEKKFGRISKSLQAKLMRLDRLKPGNLVRINENELFRVETGDGYVIPHELMHAIAGFEDNYTDPKHTAPNLMGAYHGGNSCVFTNAQVRQFVKNRGLNK